MGAVTYPEGSVGQAVSAHFVPVQIDTADGSGADVIARYRQVWTPDLRVLDPDGFEYAAWNGFLPPYEFIPRLLVARGHGLLRQGREPEAAQAFDDVVQRFPTSDAGPEAAYFSAVSRYKESHNADDLLSGWKRLQTRYPASTWRLKQSMVE